MAKLQLIKNQDGEITITKQVFGFIKLYRNSGEGEWSIFSIWYPEVLTDYMGERFEELCKNPRQTKPKKSKTVVAEFKF